MKKSGNILGFDFGLQHIGVAVGQALTQTASPLTILKAEEGIPDWQAVESLLQEWQPSQLVVGLPLNMDGSESDMSRRARKFAGRLHGRFGLPVDLYDERLSSFEAKSLVEEEEADVGHSRQKRDKKKRATVDALAAALILESWLKAQAD